MAVCPRCGHGVKKFPCWFCGYKGKDMIEIVGEAKWNPYLGKAYIEDKSENEEDE